MASKSKKSSNNSRSPSPQADVAAGDRLPFEPASTRKKPAKKPPVASASEATPTETKEKSAKASPRQDAGIPEVVSRRMARRMGFFCGIPTSLGVLTFAIAYIVVTQGWYKLPNVAVVLVSMGGFGLGVLGLSYGVISASWDEERVGSLIGWEEFSTNLGRLTQAWREAREAKQKPNP